MSSNPGRPPAGLTADEILAWPATVSVPVAGYALGLSRFTSYELVRAGEFPFQVIRVGRKLRVVTASVWDVLGLAGEAAA